ncbi:hypothetical protein [Lysobacter gummosus]|uniref:hypothetical protein n=1 Tax=Lysobacter gummosus TaxID=262324 RepID=UPI00363C2067
MKIYCKQAQCALRRTISLCSASCFQRQYRKQPLLIYRPSIVDLSAVKRSPQTQLSARFAPSRPARRPRKDFMDAC